MIGIGSVMIWGGYELKVSFFMNLITISYIWYIIVGCGSALILASFLGFIGAWKDQKCLLAIYISVTLIISILLIVIGVGIIYARTLVDCYLSSESKRESQFGSAEQGYTKAGTIMCTMNCPCDATNPYVISQCQDLAFCNKGTANILNCNPCVNIAFVNQIAQYAIEQWVSQNLNLIVTTTNCCIPNDSFENVTCLL